MAFVMENLQDQLTLLNEREQMHKVRQIEQEERLRDQEYRLKQGDLLIKKLKQQLKRPRSLRLKGLDLTKTDQNPAKSGL